VFFFFFFFFFFTRVVKFSRGYKVKSDD